MEEAQTIESSLEHIVEAIIFSSPDPVVVEDVISILSGQDEGLFVEDAQIHEAVSILNAEYEQQRRSFRIVTEAGGYCFKTQPAFHKWLRMFQHKNEQRRLSQAALEALAIVAYKQPVSKPEVDKIRGVDSGYVIRQLLEKDLVIVSGRSDSPGRPLLYKTSEIFLRHFGLNNIDDLPRPREIEEILNDEDMREHRQIMMELRQELSEDDGE